MITMLPKYMESKYFVKDNLFGHLLPEASDEDKRALEKDCNGKQQAKDLKDSYPKMKRPYYTWDGKIIDKG